MIHSTSNCSCRFLGGEHPKSGPVRSTGASLEINTEAFVLVHLSYTLLTAELQKFHP